MSDANPLREDLHTRYRDEFGGGRERRGTFIEHAKRLVDRLNAWHTRDQVSVTPGMTPKGKARSGEVRRRKSGPRGSHCRRCAGGAA